MRSLLGFGKSQPSNKSHAPPDTSGESEDAVMYRVAKDRSSRQHKEPSTIAVAYTVGSSVDNAVTFMRTVYATDEGQLFWDTITSNIPVVMEALQGLSQVHPFLAVSNWATLQLVAHRYFRVVLYRDNDKKRTLLFTKILDTMFVLVEARHLGKDDFRSTPDGKEKIASRLYDGRYWTKPQCAWMRTDAHSWHGCTRMRTDVHACHKHADFVPITVTYVPHPCSIHAGSRLGSIMDHSQELGIKAARMLSTVWILSQFVIGSFLFWCKYFFN
ncbi:hypothetical protein K438DRAFT_1780588 [Mycena galopus ATCC 62051]|nr:hypothetical protein K438DRAFT_1780588 [Mycena galopus ATCC 62051]